MIEPPEAGPGAERAAVDDGIPPKQAAGPEEPDPIIKIGPVTNVAPPWKKLTLKAEAVER